MEKTTLKLGKGIDSNELLIKMDYSENNRLLGITDPIEKLSQIIPSLYFRQNEFYKADFNSAIRGLLLNLISLDKNISINLEIHDSPFAKDYKSTKNKYIPLIIIERSQITKFEKRENLNFFGVKAKKSLKLVHGMSGAPLGGLISSLIIEGSLKLAVKSEDELIEMEGTLFSLYFNENNIEKRFDIIVDVSYVNQFNEFLISHWNVIAPPKPVKDEGCFIATACYEDYNHPIVIQLRFFRDDFLARRKWGTEFILFYYKYSPKFANIIRANKLLRLTSKVLCVYPLFLITKLIQKKEEI
jgi:hypothetical protein